MMIITMMMVMMMMMMMTSSDNSEVLSSSSSLSSPYIADTPCMSNKTYEGADVCTSPSLGCRRFISDGVFSLQDVDRLKAIARKALNARSSVNIGGPTIIDINTGYIRDSTNGLKNLFAGDKQLYDDADFSHYGRIIKKLKEHVESVFGIDEVYFTAPTFITHIQGNKDWQPQGIHDEYWHLHVDNNNTEHYHYSGLLYLSTYNDDFTGGRLKFFNHDETTLEQIIEPKAGRLAIFSSGRENPHLFEMVTSGERMVLAFWFTCNESRKFHGRAHVTFAEKIKKGLNERQKEL